MFRVVEKLRLEGSGVQYYEQDGSIDTIGPYREGGASFLVNDLNIEFNEQNEAVSVWGYCPRIGWIASRVLPPPSIVGDLISTEDLVPGVSRRITPLESFWPVLFDEQSSWLRAGDASVALDCAVQFRRDCIVGVSQGRIVGLWLRLQPIKAESKGTEEINPIP